jgi:hypothetical protein
MGDVRTVPAQIQSALPPEALRVYRAQRWTTAGSAGCRCAPRRRCVTWRQSQRRWRLRRRACQRSRLSARRHATTTSRSRRQRCVCGRSAHHARTTCDVQRLTPPQLCSSRCVTRKRRISRALHLAGLVSTAYSASRGVGSAPPEAHMLSECLCLFPRVPTRRRRRRSSPAASSAARSTRTTAQRSASCASQARRGRSAETRRRD